MSRADAKAATRAYWASQSQYVPLAERAEKFQRIGNFVSPHILFDPRVDHTSKRVYKRPHDATKVDDSLKGAYRSQDFDDRRKKHPLNNDNSASFLSSMGHSDKSAERVRRLNLMAHDAHY
jgi:hypothetical protein